MPSHTIKIKNKNAILELLENNTKFEKIIMSDHINKDDKIKEIIKMSSERKIPIEKLPVKKLPKRKNSSGFDNISAIISPENFWRLDKLLDHLYQKGEDPFFIILNNVKYAQNIGAIFRTAYGVGVNGIITQAKRDSIINEETVHISMGAIVRIPIVEMSIFESINELKKNGINIFAIDMSGKNYFKETLKGPSAFILGAEDIGVSSKIMEKIDKKISIPMKEGIDSLNVSVSAGIILYEKLRQENNNS